jgi:hypothetical protein
MITLSRLDSWPQPIIVIAGGKMFQDFAVEWELSDMKPGQPQVFMEKS